MNPSEADARTATRRTITRAAVITVTCLAIATAVALFAGLITSKMYWGYTFDRPEIDPLALDVSEVTSFSQIATDDAGALRPVGDDDRTPTIYRRDDPKVIWDLSYAPTLDAYYNINERVASALIANNVLVELPEATDEARIAELHGWLAEDGVFVDNEPGYRAEDTLHGIVMEATHEDGARRMLVSLCSGEVSNDHRAFYELVYGFGEGADRPTLISKTVFYYDVAGMEGATWSGFFLMYCVLAWPIGLVVAVVIIAIGAIRSAWTTKDRSIATPQATRQ